MKNDTTSCDSSALQSHKFPPIIDKKRETKVASISWPKESLASVNEVFAEREHLIIFTAHLIVSHYSNAEIKPIKHCINDFWREKKKKEGGGERFGCWAVYGQCYREEEYILPDWKLNNFSHCPISEVISLLNRGNLQSMKTPKLDFWGKEGCNF